METLRWFKKSTGHLLLEQIVQHATRMDVSALPAGVYLFRLEGSPTGLRFVTL